MESRIERGVQGIEAVAEVLEHFAGGEEPTKGAYGRLAVRLREAMAYLEVGAKAMELQVAEKALEIRQTAIALGLYD